jgi:chorismate mutase
MKKDLTLKKLRKQIDAADKQLLKALAKRSRVVQKIARAKAKLKLPIVDRARGAEIQKDRSQRGAQLGLSAPFVHKLFQLIQTESVHCQKKMIAHLKPKKSRSGKGIQ